MKKLYMIILLFLTANAATAEELSGSQAETSLGFRGDTITDWDGPYIGLSYGRVDDAEWIIPKPYYRVWEYGGDDNFSLYFGYTKQTGRIVYGAEVDYDPGKICNVEFREIYCYKDFLSLNGRLGYAVGLYQIYGLGGPLSISYEDLGLSISQRMNGVQYGFGIDRKLSNALHLGLNFVHREVSGPVQGYVPGNFSATNSKVSVRVGYSF